jgi:hypothetical protein
MQRGLCHAGAIIMGVSVFSSGALADPVILACHGQGFVQQEAGPTMIELDEGQNMVTVHFSGYIPPEGSYVTGKYTVGPVQAAYGAAEITFQDDREEHFVLNRLTGDLKSFAGDGRMSAGSWLCHAGAKQF